YGVHYRFEYDIDATKKSRVDIEERGYSGDIISSNCLGVPALTLKYTGSNKDAYYPVWAGNAELTLSSEINEQWRELFTGDDVKFKVKHYRFESGSWDLKYVGFLVPTLYAEPYLAPPFYTKISITDGIGGLKNEYFLDDDGNELRQRLSFITVIAMILRKTKLNLSIRCAVNILEQAMDSTDDDDVFDQCYFDTRVFYDD